MASTNKILLRRLEKLEDRLKEPQVKLPTQINLIDGATGKVGGIIFCGKQPPQAEDEAVQNSTSP